MELCGGDYWLKFKWVQNKGTMRGNQVFDLHYSISAGWGWEGGGHFVRRGILEKDLYYMYVNVWILFLYLEKYK